MNNENPIPFNPNTMTVSKAVDAAGDLKSLFDNVLNGWSEEDIGLQVKGMLKHWQQHKMKK